MVAHAVPIASYNKNFESYDKYRPNYPAEAIDKVFEVCQIKDESTVVEVAVGTGLFTNEICKRSQCKIIAVEPSEGMLQKFRENHPGIEAVLSDSTNIPLPDGSADVVLAAQAFHWFANHESLAEFRRVLKPGGVVCFVWNYEDFAAMPNGGWQERTVRLSHSYHDAVPQYDKNEWPAAFDNQQFFEPYHEAKFPYDKVVPSRDFYWEYWATRSYLTALSPSELEKAKASHATIMDEHLKPEMVSDKGEFIAKRGCHIAWARALS